jgi:hypothetical protein
VSAISQEIDAALEGADAPDRSALSQVLAQQAAIAELSQHAPASFHEALLARVRDGFARADAELVGVFELSADGFLGWWQARAATATVR